MGGGNLDRVVIVICMGDWYDLCCYGCCGVVRGVVWCSCCILGILCDVMDFGFGGDVEVEFGCVS